MVWSYRGSGKRGGGGGGRGFSRGVGSWRLSQEVGDFLLEVCQLSSLDSKSVL